MIKKNKTVGKEVYISHNYKPSKLKRATLISQLLVNTTIILAFIFFAWMVLSVGGNNVEKYCEYHAGQHDINCLLTENY